VVRPNLTGWIASAGLSYFYSGRVWVDWCSKEGTDPIETSVEKAIGFLTSQFAQGKQYCTLNTDGTSSSTTHIPVDGRKASSDFHTDEGHCHLYPPQPNYTGHWDVTKVLQGFAFQASYIQGSCADGAGQCRWCWPMQIGIEHQSLLP